MLSVAAPILGATSLCSVWALSCPNPGLWALPTHPSAHPRLTCRSGCTGTSCGWVSFWGAGSAGDAGHACGQPPRLQRHTASWSWAQILQGLRGPQGAWPGNLRLTSHSIPVDQKAPLQICEKRRAARAGGSELERGTRKDGLCEGPWTLEGRAQPGLQEVGLGIMTRHPSRALLVPTSWEQDPEVCGTVGGGLI